MPQTTLPTLMLVDENALYGDELLISVFVRFTPEQRRFRIINEADIIHAFFTARETGRFSELFTNYGFNSDGLEPRSSQLFEGIDTMQQSGLLGRKNPYLVDYSVSSGVETRYQLFIKPKVDEHPEWDEQLNELAEIVSRELSQAEPATNEFAATG